jgi:hypothetical protein
MQLPHFYALKKGAKFLQLESVNKLCISVCLLFKYGSVFQTNVFHSCVIRNYSFVTIFVICNNNMNPFYGSNNNAVIL